MLNVNASNLLEEILGAERLRDKHLSSMGDQVERYHGPFWKGSDSADYSPENHYYEYISLMVPRLIYDNPRVRVKTRRPGSQKFVAEAVRHALNRWAKDTSLRKVLRDSATDMLFNFSIIMTSEAVNKSLKPQMDTTGQSKPMWPACSRIPQNKFFIDPAATSVNDARFMGHKWVRDHEDLEDLAREDAEAGWNLEAIENLKPTTDERELGRAEKDLPDRDEVVCYEIWIPEITLEDSPGEDEGFHGTIYTLGVVSGGDEDEEDRKAMIRDPRPYYGPRWGPYTMFGVYKVPNAIYPLSPLMAIEGQVQDLNAHTLSASRSAEQYKKLILVDNTDPKFAQRVKDSHDNYVIPVSGLEKQRVVQAEVGGMTAQQLSYIDTARDRLDRNSGIGDAQRGNVEGRGTATEVQVASEASTVRMAYIRQQFADAVEQLLRTVAWFFYYDDRVVIPLGEEGQRALGLEDPWLVGGDHDPDSGATFDDLELEIEPYSMARTTEGQHQQRVMQMYQLLMNTAPMMPQMPFVNWKELLYHLGDAMNYPEIGDLIDTEMAQGMGMEERANEQRAMLDSQLGTAGKAGKARPQVTQASKISQPPNVGAGQLPGSDSGAQASMAANAQI